MNLVLFTAHYPYKGEVFLADELHVAEAYFENITIITSEKNPSQELQYIPRNSTVVKIREGESLAERIILMFPMLFKCEFWKELLIQICIRRANPWNAFKSIAIEESYANAIDKSCSELLEMQADGHTVFYSYWLNGASLFLSRFKTKGLRIARTHGGDCFFNRGIHPYREKVLDELDAVFPISEAGKNDLLAHYSSNCKALDKKIKVFHLGIILPQDRIDSWRIPASDIKTIVSCSNVISLKRLDLLVNAFHLLHNVKEARIKWVHFGDGPDMKSIQQLASRLLNTTHITYEFMGYLPNEKVLQYYASHQVFLFVNCSDAEGIPVSMMEAMSFGIPAIGRDVGGVKEIIDESCGILLPKEESIEKLADAIRNIMALPEHEYYLLRNNAMKKIYKEYNAMNNHSAFYKHIKDLAHNNE